MTKILHIEDNHTDAILLQEYVSMFDHDKEFRIEHVVDFWVGMEWLEEETFHVVFLDLGLPGIKGLEGVERIVNNFPDICLIVLSGNQSLDLAKEAIQLGAQDYLSKHEMSPTQIEKSLIFSLERIELRRKVTTQSAKLEKLSAAVEQSANIILITNIDGNIEYVNDRFVEVTGYTKREVIGKKPSLLKSGRQDEEVFKQLWDTIIEGDTWSGNFINKRKNGTLLYEKAIISPIKDENGRIVNFLAVKEDITELKAMEERLDFTLEAANLGTWEWNLKTNEMLYNFEYAKMLGFEVSELDKSLGFSRSRIHPEDFPESLAKLEQHVKGETDKYEAVYRIQHKEGHYIWIYDTGKIMEYDSQRNPIKVLGVHVDITALKEQEEKIRFEKIQLQKTQKLGRIGSWYFDLEQEEFTYVSPKCRAILGFPAEQKIDRETILDAIYGEDRELFITDFKKMCDGQHIEFLHRVEKNKQVRWVKVTGDPEFNAKGRLLGVLGLVQDITEEKERQIALEQSELKFRTIFDNATVGIVYQDSEGQILDSNKKAAEILGLDREVLDTKGAKDPDWYFIDEDHNQLDWTAMPSAKVVESKKPVLGDIVGIFNPRKSAIVWILIDSFPLIDQATNELKTCTIFTDITERRRHQLEIKDRQAKLQAAQKIANFGHWTYSYKTDNYTWSDSAYELFHLDKKIQPSREVFFKLVHPDDRKRLRDLIKQSRKSHKNTHVEFKALLPNGEVRYFEDSWETTYDPEGNPDSVLGVYHDITERKIAENELHEVKEKLLSILDSFDDIVIIIDRNLRYKEVFPGGDPGDLLAVPAKMIGKKIADFMPDDVSQLVKEAFVRIKESSQTESITYSIQFGAKTKWFDAKLSALHDQKGMFNGVTMLVRNVTEQKLNELALQESESKFRMQSEFLPHILWTADSQGKTNYINEAGRHFYGDNIKYYHQGRRNGLHKDDREQARLKWEEALANKSSYFNLERHKDASGKYKWLSVKANPILDENQNIISWIGVSTNVNAEMEAKRQNEKLVFDLKERVKEAKCLYGISHLAESGLSSKEDLLRQAVQLIPPAFQYPECTQAQIIFDDNKFNSGKFTYKNRYSSPLRMDGVVVGEVAVAIAKRNSEGEEINFLPEEVSLMDAISENLGLILKHKRAVRLVAESEQRFRVLLENATIGIALLKDYRFVDCNKRMSQIFNMPISELNNKAMWELSPSHQPGGRTSEEATKYHVGQLEVRKDENFIWYYKDGQGNTIIANIHLNKIELKDGEYVMAFLRDITQEYQAVKALEESENKYRSIFENIQEGYILVDTNGEILELNPEGARILGRPSQKQLLGKNINNFIPHSSNLFEVSDLNKTRHNIEVLFNTESGEKRWLNFNVQTVFKNGAPYLFESTFSDVTEQHKFNEFLSFTVKLYEAYQKSLEELIQRGVEYAVELLDSNCGFYHFVDEDEGKIKFVQWSQEGVSASNTKKRIPDYEIEEAGIWKDCIDKRKPVIHSQEEQISDKGIPEGHPQLNRDLEIPIIDGNKVVAILGVGNKVAEYSTRDIELLTNYANLLHSLVKKKELEIEYLNTLETFEESQNVGRIGTWRYDMQFEETWWSDVMFELYGLKRKDGVPLQEWLEYTHPDDREMQVAKFAESLKTGKYECEYRIVLKSGEVRYLFAKSRVEYDANGEPKRHIGIAQDVTAIKKALLLIQEQSQQFQNIVSSLPGIVYRLKFPSSQIEFISEYLHKLLGYSVNEIEEIGHEKFLKQVIYKEDFESSIQFLKNVLKEENEYSYTFRMMTKDGKIIWVSNTGKLVYKEGSEYVLEGFIHDITDRVRSEERILNAVMEASDQERSRISKEIHDSLQQTLTIASLNLEFVRMEKAKLSDKVKNKFDIGYNYLKKSLNDSRAIAHSLMPKAIEDFGFVSVVKDTISDLNQSSQVEFEFLTNMEGIRLKVPIDTSLYKIVQEATNNILKHSEARYVTIQYMKLGDVVQLTIEDDGKGFDASKLSQSKGGFGLANMKNRVSSFGAEIYIDSHVGHGTTIMIEFPFTKDILYYE
ncbi:PAS domain S-box protein [Roseivirga thermotolerans]|uniref:PAS domain S-box protein n=1 Tax=Roseivirga thermotolerans TaxID=1758176 RepID=UPI00273F8244|nr:PAS domain S-box protein [Roseivirga thermotolerans]